MHYSVNVNAANAASHLENPQCFRSCSAKLRIAPGAIKVNGLNGSDKLSNLAIGLDPIYNCVVHPLLRNNHVKNGHKNRESKQPEQEYVPTRLFCCLLGQTESLIDRN